MIRSSVDIINSKHSSGWVYSDAKGEQHSVEALLNGQVIGKAVANILRPDLLAAGFGDGKCGFHIQFSKEVDPIFLPFIQINLSGTDLELRRWAPAGFHDYYRALYQRYPRAGRSASVFGGLWTDRSDASSVLKGRVDIGLTASGAANRIARYINDGLVAIDREAAKVDAGTKPGDMPAAVADVLFGDTVLQTVRGVFDDNPVAIRADAVEANVEAFSQLSTIEDLPSPAECLGLLFSREKKSVPVEIIRGSHHLPEFHPDGTSRWTHAAAERVAHLTASPTLPVESHMISRSSLLLVSPGLLYRIRAAAGSVVRVLLIPSRTSLLRFHQKPPTGEITHDSGARIWL